MRKHWQGKYMSLETEHNVASTIWPWRTPPQAPVDGGNRMRHRRALVQCFVTAAIATLLTLWLGRYRLGLSLYGLSAAILICGFLAPKAFDALERFGQILAYAVALTLTWILLMPFFYLCFAPAHLILKLMSKDPLQRRLERDRISYWVDHQPPSTPHPYKRQY